MEKKEKVPTSCASNREEKRGRQTAPGLVGYADRRRPGISVVPLSETHPYF